MFNLKRQFLLDPTVTFLNHGSFGACPRPVFHDYQRWQRELERQPVEFLGRRHDALLAQARQALGEYLGADADDLVFTINVTVSLNIVARSLELGAGDEVLTTDHEYGAIDRTWRFLAGERGFSYIRQPISGSLQQGVDAFVEELWQGVTTRTRLISLSHITSPTALLFPVEAVIRRARQAGILSVVDGAHAPGQIPLDLNALGADFYGGNLHKWLCAPKGAGFLYARREMQNLLKPLVVSWGFEAENPGGSRFIDHHQWTGTRDIAAFLAVPAAIRFQQENKWDKVRSACHDLVREAQARIQSITHLSELAVPGFSLSADGHGLQMGVIPLLSGTDLAALKTSLHDHYAIEIPTINWNGLPLLRISVQGYNSRRDVDRLVDALGNLLPHVETGK